MEEFERTVERPIKSARIPRDQQYILDRIEKTPDGCWMWQKAKTMGYGMYSDPRRGGQVNYAHRLAYEQWKGDIPPRFTIDHLCANRGCVNPEHLEAVSNTVNIQRGYDKFPPTTRIHLVLPVDMLEQIDTNSSTIGRSAWIREVLAERLAGTAPPGYAEGAPLAVEGPPDPKPPPPKLVPTPVAEGCPHPKAKRQNLGYMTRCGVCGVKLK